MNLFLDTLSGKKSAQVPLWFMRQAGRYLPEYRKLRADFPDFLSFCYTPEAACEVTLQPLRRFDMSAAILFCDILVIPDALGQEVRFVAGEGPKLKPLETPEDVAALTSENLLSHLAPVFEAINLLKKQLPQEKALIGFAGAPWTVACYMIEGGGSKDFAKVRQFAYSQPEAFQQLLDLLIDATCRYFTAQIEAGVDALQLFDSWAGILPPADYERFVIAPTRAIRAYLRAHHPAVPMIGFARASGINLAAYAEASGCNGFGIDSMTPLGWAKDRIAAHGVLQGNLDPYLLAGDKAGALAATDQILRSWRDIPFIFNLGHGILPHTPIDHVEAVIEKVTAFRREA